MFFHDRLLFISSRPSLRKAVFTFYCYQTFSWIEKDNINIVYLEEQTALSDIEQELVAGCSTHRNVTSVSVRHEKIPNELSNYQIPKEDFRLMESVI